MSLALDTHVAVDHKRPGEQPVSRIHIVLSLRAASWLDSPLRACFLTTIAKLALLIWLRDSSRGRQESSTQPGAWPRETISGCPESQVREPWYRFLNWYVAELHVSAQNDTGLAMAFQNVTNLLDPPQSLLRPRLAARVLSTVFVRQAARNRATRLEAVSRGAF